MKTPRPKRNEVKPVRTVAIMMAITIIGKIMGLLRDSMQAAQFGGDTPEAIAFAQAVFLPNTFLDIMFAAAFSASFIPVFSGFLTNKGKEAAFNLAALFISVVAVLTAGVTVVSVIFAQPILTLSLGSDPVPYGTIAMGVTLLRIMFPLMILSGLAFSFTGILQSLGEFRLPAAMSIVSNGVILIYYFFFIDRFGVYGLAVAFLLGWAAQGAIQLPFLLKHKFKYRFSLNLKDPSLRQIGKLALPVMISSWVVPINIAVNVMAAQGEFGVTSIHFANRLFAIISGVFILSVTNVIFPKMSRQAAEGDLSGFSETVNETVRVLLFFLLPLTLGLVALSQPLVGLILGWGDFCENAVHATGTALRYFAIGVVGFGIFAVLSRACYARLDGRTPITAAVVAIGANAAFSFLIEPALANAISQLLGAMVLVIVLTAKDILKWPMSTIFDLAKMAVIAAVMFAAVYVSAGYVAYAHVILQVGVPAIIGVMVYIGLAAVIRIKEMRWVLTRGKTTL